MPLEYLKTQNAPHCLNKKFGPHAGRLTREDSTKYSAAPLAVDLKTIEHQLSFLLANRRVIASPCETASWTT